MAILDNLQPTYYKVREMAVTRDGGIGISYTVEILGANGHRIGQVYPVASLTTQERSAIVAIYQRDKDDFETATGLTEWTG